MKWLFVLILTLSSHGQTTNVAAQVTREVVTNWLSLGTLRLNSGTNYDVLMPQIFTNVIVRAEFEGRKAETVLRSDEGPRLTNFCDLKFQMLDVSTRGPGAGWAIEPPPLPILPSRTRQSP